MEKRGQVNYLEEKWRELPQFHVDSYEDAVLLLKELDEEFLKLGKRIRITMEEFRLSLEGKLWSRVKSLGKQIADAFRVETLEDYNQAAAIYGAELAGTLYQLHGSFAGFKIAIIQAAAPIVELLVPVVRLAVDALTGLANSIGYVLRLLFQGGEEAQSYAGGMYGAAAANTALKRSLAGFDQINRLNQKTSSGGVYYPTAPKPLTGAWKDFAEKLAELLKPLQKIDLTPAAKSLERLRKALEPITKSLFEALEWAWYNIFVPMAQWAAEELLPVFLDTLTAALEALAQVIEELKPAFLWLWENYLKPLAQWKADELIRYLQGLTAELNGTGECISGNQNIVDRFIQSGLTMIDTITEMAGGYMNLSGMGILLSESFGELTSQLIWAQTPFGNTNTALGMLGNTILQLADDFGFLNHSSNSTWTNLQSVWGKAWDYLKEKTMDPAYEGFRSTTNGMINLINGILRGVTKGVNFLTGSMNSISFKLPDWIPLIGGKGFSFSFPRLEAPQIPLLAKGAVLPANKPFMAVVGDQRHGTNVEAPLTTIQEAVAAVMEDYAAANLAGHEATVAVLRELLSAVLGIQIGDETIAAAVSRYDRKMAVVRGG